MLKTIWQFLNERLIVAALLVLAVIVGIRLQISSVADSFEIDRQTAERRMVELSKINIAFLKEVPTTESQPQKFIAKLEYKGNEVLGDLRGKILFCDSNGRAIDIFESQILGIEHIRGGREYDVYITRPLYRDSSNSGRPSAEVVDNTAKQILRVIDARILE